MGRATVIVADDRGGFVGAATVDGTFSGDFGEGASGDTGASGTVVLTTSAETKKPAFTFCVGDITLAGLTYASGDNNATCASYP
jgi:hypothetical protein